MLDDSLLIQCRDGAMQALSALKAQENYHAHVVGVAGSDAEWYDAQRQRYNQLIAAINQMFEPVE